MTISKVMQTMLQPIRTPISIFSAFRPTTAASQIHSDEPQTCAIPSTELATPARSENGPSAWLIATPNPTENPAQMRVMPTSITACELAVARIRPAARNSTYEVSISMRWLKILSAKGVEKETAILTMAVKAITVEYSPRSKPMVSISKTGETFT